MTQLLYVICLKNLLSDVAVMYFRIVMYYVIVKHKYTIFTRPKIFFHNNKKRKRDFQNHLDDVFSYKRKIP